MARSLAVEATSFWLIVSAILIAAPFDPADLILTLSALITAAVYVVVAYICWSLRRWGFIAAIILALFTTIGGIAFGFTQEANTFEVLSASGWLVVPQLILIFFSQRAYREMGEKRSLT